MEEKKGSESASRVYGNEEECDTVHTVTLTEVVKSSVHDAGFSSINPLDLVSSQRPCWQRVVVIVPALETLKPHFGTTPQQPLCCSSIRTHSLDPLVVHPEWSEMGLPLDF